MGLGLGPHGPWAPMGQRNLIASVLVALSGLGGISITACWDDPESGQHFLVEDDGQGSGTGASNGVDFIERSRPISRHPSRSLSGADSILSMMLRTMASATSPSTPSRWASRASAWPNALINGL